jgi:hypothetical protein
LHTRGCQPSAGSFPKIEILEERPVEQIAGTIVHEEWHVRHGADERGAYFAQLMALQQLGLGPGTGVYHNVKLAMRAVLAAQATRNIQPTR